MGSDRDTLTPFKLGREIRNVDDNDAGFGNEALDHLIAKSTAASCDNHKLTLGGISELPWCTWSAQMPVIQRKLVEIFIESARCSNDEEVLQETHDT